MFEADNDIVAVFGATGQQGAAVAAELHHRGIRVRAIGRDPEKLARLAKQGFETAALTAFEHKRLDEALAGTRAAFVTLAFAAGSRELPIDEVARAVCSSMERNGIRHSIWTTGWLASEAGMQVSKTFDSLRAMTEVALTSGVNCGVLQPAGYLENYLTDDAAGALRAGKMAYMLPADFRYRWVSHLDQAAFAADLLLGHADVNAAFALGVPATGNELAQAASRALGRTIRYHEVEPEAFADEWRKTLGQAADAIAQDYLTIVENAEHLGLQDRGQEIVRLTGRQYTSLQNFFFNHAGDLNEAE